jgi:hypothetical protein
MKLLLVTDYYYIFYEIYKNFDSFTINLMEIFHNLKEHNLFLKTFQKFIVDFTIL